MNNVENILSTVREKLTSYEMNYRQKYNKKETGQLIKEDLNISIWTFNKLKEGDTSVKMKTFLRIYEYFNN